MALSAGSEFHKGSTSSSEVQSNEQHADEDASGLCDDRSTQVEILAEDFPNIAIEDIPLPPSPPPIPVPSTVCCGNGPQSKETEMSARLPSDVSHDELSKVSMEDQNEQRVALADDAVERLSPDGTAERSSPDGTAERPLPSTDVSFQKLERNSLIEPSLGKCQVEHETLPSVADMESKSVKAAAISQPESESGKEQALPAELVGKPGCLSETKRNIPRNEKRPYLCTECRRRFVERDDLLQHLYDHIAEFTGKHPFRCPKCPGRRFPDMKQHERHHQMGLECDICGEAFHAAIVIAEHRLRVHSRKKTFSCKVCSRKYATSEELAQHQQKRHRKSKPLICKTCGKSFKSKESLSTHMRVHSEEQSASSSSRSSQHGKKTQEKVEPSAPVEAKKISCSKCGLDFSTKEKLTEHKKNAHISQQEKKTQAGSSASSKLYKCKSCEMDFSTIGDLIEHQQSVHTSQQEKIPETVTLNYKKYKCKKCRKDFPTRRKLNEHNMSVHIDQQNRNPQAAQAGLSLDSKPYKCEQCVIDFSTEEKLNEHNLSAHIVQQENHPQTSPLFDYIPYKTDVSDMCVIPEEHITELNMSATTNQHEQHLQTTTITGYKPHKCEECGIDFSTEEELKKHNVSVHIAEPEISPQGGADSDYEPYNGGSDRDFSDDEQIYEPSMPPHTSQQEETPRTCSFFDYKPHKCEECRKDFFTEAELNEHNLFAHIAQQESSTQEASSDYKLHTRPYIAHETNLSSLEKLNHNKSAHKSPQRLSISSHYKPLKCDECEIYFSTKEKLHDHSKSAHTHHRDRRPQIATSDSRPYSSDVSKMDFFIKEELSNNKSEHISYQKRFPHRGTLTDYKPFKCDECEIDFSTKEKLNEHNLFTHEGEHQNDLQTGTSSFRIEMSNIPNSSAHPNQQDQIPQFTPLNQKPYKCEECGTDFSAEEKLNEHNVSAHIGENKNDPQTEADSDDEPFKIEVSKSYFSSNDQLLHEFHVSKITPDIGQKKNNQQTEADSDYEPFKIEVSKTFFSTKEKFGVPNSPAHLNQQEQVPQFPPFLDQKPYKCEECGTDFSSEEKLNEHNVSAHIDLQEKGATSSDHEPQNEASDMEFSDEEQVDEPSGSAHLNQPDENLCTLPKIKFYKCKECGMVFFTKIRFDAHSISHISEKDPLTGTSSDNGPYKCGTSVMDFSTEVPLHKQEMSVHESHQEIIPPKRSDSEPSKCGVVETGSSTKEKLSEHNEVAHTSQEINQCTENLCTLPKIKFYKCKECGRVFFNKTRFDAHSISHISEKDPLTGTSSDNDPYKCGMSVMDFSTEVPLHKQEMSVHESHQEIIPPKRSDSEPSKCGVVGPDSSTKQKLSEHNEVAHTGQLKNNVQIDTSPEALQPYIWNAVQMYFSNKDKVKSAHTVQHENNLQTSTFSENRPIISDGAGINFSTNKKLNELNESAHTVQHEQNPPAGPSSEYRAYKAEVYEKDFSTKEKLNDHYKSAHTSQLDKNLQACSSADYRPYICEECGANFSQKQALRDHEMRHRVDRPHKCLHFCVNCLHICDYSSSSSAGLADHMKKYHEVCFECKFSDKWS